MLLTSKPAAGGTIFHVHTYRCGHAEPIPDEAYIQEAIRLGASDIWFTDHAPFPGDPFGARMAYAELDEYLETLTRLRQRYREITVHIGLETEYFPGFDAAGYYRELRAIPELEMLLLGQHMAEISSDPPAYSFSESRKFLDANEYRLLGKALVQGAASGYFDAIAHPDRIFRRYTGWDAETEAVSREIIQAAIRAGLPLEMNLCSAESPLYHREAFWKLVPDTAARLIGFDAHTLHEMQSRFRGMSHLLKVLDKDACHLA